MKKILAAVFACLLLTGCGGANNVTIHPTTVPRQTVPVTTVPEATVPETTVPETTVPPVTVARVEQTFTGEYRSSPNNATILTAYDENGSQVWQWTSDVVANDGQLTMLTAFAESGTQVFVVVDDKLVGLDRETGKTGLEIHGMSGAQGIAVDGMGTVYVTDYFSGNVLAYNSNGVQVLDLYNVYPQLEDAVYWGYGPEYLGGNVMKFCFEACDDEEAAAGYCYVDQNQWGWDYWYVLLDTTTMELILP